jgi:phosphoribosylformylglycinamidine synthase subunit PurQ / glutaminase
VHPDVVGDGGLQFRCEQVFLKTLNHDTPFTSAIPRGRPAMIPIAHGEGCYFADEPTLAALRDGGRILWQYCDARGEVTDSANPNGSLLHIAGIANERRNVAGLMPHPDRAAETLLGSEDGRGIFESMIAALASRRTAAAA